MIDFLKNSGDKDHASLGRELVSWVYKPKKSNRFLIYILGLLGALIVFAVMYGSRFLPWLEKLPDALIYILFLAIGPLLNYFRSFGKSQQWSLHEYGYRVKYMNEGKGTGDEKINYWHEFSTCTYDANVVTLVPRTRFKSKVKLRTSRNAMEIYSICRERISIAQAARLHRKTRAPKTPDTPEQRRMAKIEKQYARRFSGTTDWQTSNKN
jgi:hypothetical protein